MTNRLALVGTRSARTWWVGPRPSLDAPTTARARRVVVPVARAVSVAEAAVLRTSEGVALTTMVATVRRGARDA